MTSMELLETLVAVKDKYVLEAHSGEIPNDNIIQLDHYIKNNHSLSHRQRISLKRSFLIAAIAVMMLLLVGCAVILYKLQELKIGEYTYNPSYTNPYVESSGTSQPITEDLISLQGFTSSINYQAAKEWNDFLQSYDKDGTLLKNAETDDYQESMEYMAYTCYTREMQDKLEEICDKYGLEILGPTYTNMYVIMEMYGIDYQKSGGSGELFSESANVPVEIYDGYFYRDGTFQFGATVTMNYEGSPWIYPTNYQYRCVMKSALDTVCLSVGNIEEFEEWNDTLQDGTQVLLALSPEKALIIVDKPEYFVTVNILETRVGDVLYGEQQMTREGLKALAETFSFDYEPVKPDPAYLIAP